MCVCQYLIAEGSRRERTAEQSSYRLVNRTRMSGEAHVRFWEGLGAKLMTINLVDIQDFFPYPQWV
ncbi:MAG: hypothetical protein A2170_13745 [Deltaproteobacteria bacterium RBG_13_53_10]|nr:MAG: hypothetical protein A2170_13745 [Deltaproteobacteria bacterium RBG_13_53_10]